MRLLPAIRAARSLSRTQPTTTVVKAAAATSQQHRSIHIQSRNTHQPLFARQHALQRTPITAKHQPVRHLNLHEYQSKSLMEKYGVRVQRGGVADNAAKAKQVADDLLKSGAKELVVKAQIHAGGRGKGESEVSINCFVGSRLC